MSFFRHETAPVISERPRFPEASPRQHYCRGTRLFLAGCSPAVPASASPDTSNSYQTSFQTSKTGPKTTKNADLPNKKYQKRRQCKPIPVLTAMCQPISGKSTTHRDRAFWPIIGRMACGLVQLSRMCTISSWKTLGNIGFAWQTRPNFQ